MSAYTLYIGNKNYSSWSLRPWLLLRERGIGFDEVLLPFEADNHGRFKAVAPNARRMPISRTRCCTVTSEMFTSPSAPRTFGRGMS